MLHVACCIIACLLGLYIFFWFGIALVINSSEYGNAMTWHAYFTIPLLPFKAIVRKLTNANRKQLRLIYPDRTDKELDFFERRGFFELDKK
jgi:hypothetical protein